MSVLDDATLASQRAALEEERETLRKEIKEQGADPDSEGVGLDFERGFADSAQSTAERARVISLVEGLRHNLRDVEHALAKIERGTYGLCERCGKRIDRERLEALPSARVCITCKQKES